MSESHADQPISIPEVNVEPLRKIAQIAAPAGLGLFLVLAMANNSGMRLRDLFLAYLCGFIFWACVPFGALGLTMIGHLTSASWGVVLRRMFQASMRTLPYVAALFAPILISLFINEGESSPYWWTDHEHVAKSMEDLKAERPTSAGGERKTGIVSEADEKIENLGKINDWLHPSFFLVRAVIYFLILGVFAHLLNKWAKPAEDTDDPHAWQCITMLSGPGVVIWVLTLTLAATDWVMSIEPTWASSMFPVVFGMNMFLTTFAFSILVFYTLCSDKTEIMGIVKDKFRIDMGSLLFSFTMLWAYASFCQYMLIWSANLPEELVYYRKRGDHGWEYLAYFLMAFHWLAPFVVLLFREMKTDPQRIVLGVFGVLLVCCGDIIWWLVPAVEHPEGGLYVPMALAAIVGVGGIWGMAFVKELARRPILATNAEVKFLATWGHH